MNEVDTTVREAEATMARMDRLLAEAAEVLKRGEEMAAQGATPELARGFIEKQGGEICATRRRPRWRR